MRTTRSQSALTYLLVTAVLILSGLFVYRTHPLVQIASDPPDTSAALFPTGELQPGQSTTAAVTLFNRGLIPFDYSLAVTGPAGQAVVGDFRLRVMRAAAHELAYDGPLPESSHGMGRLYPGEAVRLELTVSNPAGSRGRTSLDALFRWRAQGVLLGDWWTPLYVLGLGALDVVILGIWLGDTRRRSRRKAP